MSIVTHSALVWVTIDNFHRENVTIKQLNTQEGNECFRVVSFFILTRNSVAVFLMLSLSLISFLSLLSSTCGLYYIIGKSVNLESSFGGRGPGRLSLIPRWQMLVENLRTFMLWKYSHSVCSKPDMNKQHFSTTDADANRQRILILLQFWEADTHPRYALPFFCKVNKSGSVHKGVFCFLQFIHSFYIPVSTCWCCHNSPSSTLICQVKLRPSVVYTAF